MAIRNDVSSFGFPVLRKVAVAEEGYSKLETRNSKLTSPDAD
jgi:hypothetical protein